MKKNYLLLLFITIVSVNVKSQCSPNTTKVLVMGDSWAAFCWQYDVHNINFDKYGFSDKKAYSTGSSISPTGGTPDLSQSGSEARNYLTTVKKSVILSTFANNPDIDIVHLSLGGNDFLGDWDTTWTPSQINTLAVEVLDSITSIISFLRQQKPNVKILLSAYDYPNFAEAINGSTSHPFYNRWAAMLKPRFSQINSVLASVNTVIKNYALAGTNLYFVDNLGLMQYTYGQNSPLLFPPGGTYAPQSVPFPGGNPNYPSPLVAMNTYFTIKDAFHLSSAGYTVFVENQVKEFYFNAFRDYDITTPNESLKSGYVNASAAFSDTSVVVGNIGGVQHLGLLSFQMPVLDPSKSVDKVSIFMKRKGSVGLNPINTYSLSVDMKIGSLGSSALPDNADFSAVSDVTATACHFGSVSANNYWLRIDLPASMAQQLVSNQTYQFRVGFVGNGTTNQALEFYSDANAPNTPFLDLQYAIPLSVNSLNKQEEKQMSIYPNPAEHNTCMVQFSNTFSGSIELIDLLGNKVYAATLNDGVKAELKFPDLNNGMYILIANDNKTQKVFNEKMIIKK
jgi:lysophospholipase L1-like esterase